jgi:hypothetical protein
MIIMMTVMIMLMKTTKMTTNKSTYQLHGQSFETESYSGGQCKEHSPGGIGEEGRLPGQTDQVHTHQDCAHHKQTQRPAHNQYNNVIFPLRIPHWGNSYCCLNKNAKVYCRALEPRTLRPKG